MEKLLMLLGDQQLVDDLRVAVSELEGRVGGSEDIDELKEMIRKVRLLIKPILKNDGRRENRNSSTV